MEKEYNDQLLKFKLTDEDVKMTIKIEDIVWLFHNSPNNSYSEFNMAKVKQGREKDFVELIIEFLIDDENTDSKNFNWGVPLEKAFDEIMCSATDTIYETVKEQTNE